MKPLSYSFWILLFAATTAALNIIAILPYEGKSHFFVFKVLLQELANRGHNVTVISHFPEKNSRKNYHDISLSGTVKIVEDDVDISKHNKYISVLASTYYLSMTGINNCEILMDSSRVRGLIRQGTKFDIALVEQFNSDCALGLAYKLKVPVVGMTSHILMPWHYSRFGIAYNPSYVPHHFLNAGMHPTLFDRIERTILNILQNSVYYLITQRSNQNTLSKYYNDIPPLDELSSEMKFILLYQNFILTGSRLYPHNVIEVGGYHVTKPKPLTGDLKKFFDEADHGVVYISFGSVIKSSSLSKDKREAILAAINEFPQRFVWKWESDTLSASKDKLYTSNWLPQVDILGHKKTLAFFSHGGMCGTTEAIHFGVPIIAMPIFGDQPSNAAAIADSGMGIKLEIGDLTKDNLVKAFKTVLDPEFRKNTTRISQAWHDRPLSPMDTAVFWTEFAARHSNFTFRTRAADVPAFQYYNLDIIIVLSLIMSCIALIFYSIFTCCCKLLFKSKLKTNGKRKRE